MISGGSPVIFVARPISALFMGAALLAYLRQRFVGCGSAGVLAGQEARVGLVPS